ncbi:MAG: hypothetical protein ABIN89_30455 [Chitinophagaceae bacterium]
MNKWIPVLLTCCIILISGIYLFIPAKLSVSNNKIINCTINGANRFLLDETKWIKWWPAGNATVSNINNTKIPFNYEKYSFEINKIMYNKILVTISDENGQIKTNINILPVNMDTIVTQWQYIIATSLNPVKRIIQYQQAKMLKKNMEAILSELKSFLEKKSNIYGADIHEIISSDSTLITTKLITTTYPVTTEIYQLIKTLRNYISSQQANENNYPMLNVKKVSDSQFETMVAIPVDRKLEGSGKIFFSRFVPWRTLVAEVKGGNWTTEEARRQMQLYIHDYNRTPYAIPFQSLITDRSLQTDTLKWVTKICQAVS